MTDIATNLATIEACGYEVIGHFVEPESAWWDHYLLPLEARLRIVRQKYAGDAEHLAIVEGIQLEIDMYRKHSAYYGNVFYQMRRR